MTEVETDRLRLRMFTPDDLPALYSILSDPHVVTYLGAEAGRPFSLEETEDIMTKAVIAWDKYGFGRWAIVDKESRALIGFCGFRSWEGVPELLYVLAR